MTTPLPWRPPRLPSLLLCNHHGIMTTQTIPHHHAIVFLGACCSSCGGCGVGEGGEAQRRTHGVDEGREGGMAFLGDSKRILVQILVTSLHVCRWVPSDSVNTSSFTSITWRRTNRLILSTSGDDYNFAIHGFYDSDKIEWHAGGRVGLPTLKCLPAAWIPPPLPEEFDMAE